MWWDIIQGFVANLPLSLLAKKIENWLIFGEIMGKSLVSCFFDSRFIFSVKLWDGNSTTTVIYYTKLL